MTMRIRFLLLAAGLTVGLSVVIVGLFLVMPAMAIEPICPGGSSPRADIALCVDFDTLTNCTTGTEDQCWSDNGYNGHGVHTGGQGPYAWTIAKDGGAVGNGYVRVRPRPGAVIGTGGFFEPPPGFLPLTNAFSV